MISDTISQKPEVGVFSGMVGVALSPVQLISLISAIIGLLIAIITLTIKIIDIRAKIKQSRRIRKTSGSGCDLPDDNEDYVIIGDRRYKYHDNIEE